MPRHLEIPKRLKLFRIENNEGQFEPIWPEKIILVIVGPPTRKKDEEERIILMKFRSLRFQEFIKIILSSSSSPDFNLKIKNIIRQIYNNIIL